MEISPIKIVIGLGNPGHQYSNTRHNIGFRVLDALCTAYDGRWTSKQLMEEAEIMVDGKRIILIKPTTYMNSSGLVIPILRKQGFEAENILVVHDELELPFGTIKCKQGGSAKGHNGLRSIIQSCGDNFMRVRIGIDRPTHKEEVPNYVLHKFNETNVQVQQLVDDAVVAIVRCVTNKVQADSIK